MTTTGWIIVSIIFVISILFGFRLFKDYQWNKKLHHFHQSKRIIVPKVPVLYWLKRAYGFTLSSFAVVTIVACGTFTLPIREPNTYLTAKVVGSEANLLALINARNQFSKAVDALAPGSPEADLINEDSSGGRDFIDTNMQVDGVIEADIVKTDGYTIYYATRYQNKIRVIDILDDGAIDVREDIDLGELYTDSIYITETQLIVIGYIYQHFYWMPSVDGDSRDYYYGGFSSYTGAVYVFDRSTLELEYSLETDTNFYQHRLIGDALYLLSSKYLYTTDLVPTFTETKNDESNTYDLGYDSIYYFEGMPAYSMTVIGVLDLDSYTFASEAFLGQVYQIYANQSAIYTTATVYEYEEQDGIITWWNGQVYTYIVKYEINPEAKTFSYAASGKVKGYIENQYWMDEYNGYFRIVTTAWGSNVVNRLYILQTNKETQTFDQVGIIEDGLGKERETVKSVRFNQEKVNVVTYETIDPLYTINVSDPTNPFILPNPIEEPGYNTYMHTWNEDHYLIGIGYDENFQLKLSAYDDSDQNPNLGEPLMTYYLAAESEDGIYSYTYSEVLYNPKAIMVDVERGIFGFPVNTYRYTYNPLLGYYDFAYQSLYYIFSINFEAEDVNDIISEPIIISQDEFMYYAGIDRGVYIEFEDFVMIYTLSYSQIIAFNLTTREVVSTFTFEGMDIYNPYVYIQEDEEGRDDEETPPIPGD